MDQPRIDRRRKPPGESPRVTVAFRVDPDLRLCAERLAADRGVPAATILRDALARGLAQEP
jgi:hypothetical protein